MVASTRRREHSKKLREYARFLRDDHDWDYAYILRVLRYKLERTRRCIVSNDLVQSASKIGRQISRVEGLLERVIDDKYVEEIGVSFYAKYGRPRMLVGRAAKGERSAPVTIKFAKETVRNSEKLRRRHHALVAKADRMRRRDLATAFRIMEKHIWGWWD